VPAAAQAVTGVAADRVVGTGTPASCTSDAVVAAVAQGGVIGFNCGAAPVTITMTRTAKVFNDKPDVVLDGGGKVTLSGGGALRILYQNTCDPAQVWTSARCELQDQATHTVQRLTLSDGISSALR
jgi:S-adenosylhomocysteine hydrolase